MFLRLSTNSLQELAVARRRRDGLAHELEPDLRAESEHVAELNVQEAERLEQSRVRERPCIDRIEPDRARGIDCHALCFGIVTRDKHAEPLFAKPPAVHVLRELRVECLHHARARQFLLQLLGATRRVSKRKLHVLGQRVRHVDDGLTVDEITEQSVRDSERGTARYMFV
jgi:hypothetical protein